MSWIHKIKMSEHSKYMYANYSDICGHFDVPLCIIQTLPLVGILVLSMHYSVVSGHLDVPSLVGNLVSPVSHPSMHYSDIGWHIIRLIQEITHFPAKKQ